MILLKETKRIDLQKPSANEESPPHEVYDPLLNRVEVIDSSADQEERNTMRLLLYSSLIVVIRLRIILSGIHYPSLESVSSTSFVSSSCSPTLN